MDCDHPENTDQLTDEFDPRARTREITAEFAARGDSLGWFEALYKESAGDLELIPWADLEPNRFFTAWAEKASLKGNGRNALVVGCGLGDDARYLHDLGFKVTAFDISPTALEWAKRCMATPIFNLRRRIFFSRLKSGSERSILCLRFIRSSRCRLR